MIPTLICAPLAEPRPAARRGRPIAAAAGMTASGAVLVEAGPSRAELAAMAADPAGWTAAVGVDAAVAQVAALGAWAALLWVAVGGLLLVLARLPGAAGAVAAMTADAVLPRVLRRALEAALGVSLVAGAVAGTLPAAAQTPSPVASTAADVGPLERPFSPPSPTSSPTLAPSATPAAPASSPVTPPPATVPASTAITVVPGDCLWDIAEEYLGDQPSNRDIDRAWRRWYAANAETVGPDPGLIHPGQRLVPPPDAGLPSAPHDAGGTS